ncbi:MAG: GH92 family glycosyl hydrolase [Prevotella sp.]|nr:GH92 family glycosyl hydrolase [Prevotella sp.]MCI1282565.1 GH92 family glycosyl hydrolase [Prevotella sp.]
MLLFGCILYALMGMAGEADYAHKVNTLIGTNGIGLTSGYLFPGASYPHGMVQFTPSYFAKQAGFVVNQVSGGGCEHMGNFPTFPIKGRLTTSPNTIRDLHIELTNEKGHAGFYETNVQEDIKARLTVTKRTGMAEYEYPATEDYGTVIIGAGLAATRIKEAAVVITAPNKCEGYADGGYFCGIRTPFKVYFAAEFDCNAIESGTWKRMDIHPGNSFAEGEFSGVYFTFNLKQHRTIHYKVGVSYVSVDNARENLKTENPGWNFLQIVNNAEQQWNKYLSRIEVKGDNSARITQFYTHLYHAFIHPNIDNDVNGEYMGADFRIHKTNTNHYTSFSNWDTYRTQIQLLSIIEPDVASDIVISHQLFAEQSGGVFPRWVMANIETGIMQGDPSPILISNAWAFGARSYDAKLILAIMRKGAEVPGMKSQEVEERPLLRQYLEKGYCNASLQLEYTSSDFAIGQFALNAAKDKQLSERYFQQARSWKNLYNPETGWLQSRNPDGSWKPLSEDFREATYRDYYWMVPYSLGSLINLSGGKTKAEKRLDEYFQRLDAGYDDPWFASGNEPSFGVPWVYNWVGAPYKTQKVINRILNEEYSDQINGLPGNDDLGAMGAWYVYACIGLYPEIPGVGGLSINTPIFPFIKMHLKGGDLLIKGGSEKNIYIKGMKLNGKPYPSTWLNWEHLEKGATLEYSTSSNPQKTWGTKVAPPSYD